MTFYVQVSGRLFDAVPRRSSRLAGESKSSALGSITSSGSGPGSSGAGGGLYTLAGSSGTTSRSSGNSLQSSGIRKGLSFGSMESSLDDGG